MATMRITTGMAMNTYRHNMQNSTYNVNNSRNKLLTGRRFDSFAADPTSAAQAWKIRRAMVDNSNYQSNNSNTYSRFNIGWATMGMIKTDLEKEADAADIRARQDANAGARVDLGKVLNDTAESVIQAMNSAKFGDHFVFSGDDEMNAPFSWSDDMKTLYYRGVNVNAGMVKNPADPKNIPEWAKDADGNLLEVREEADLPEGMPETAAAGSDDEQWIKYYKDDKEALENGTTRPPMPTTATIPDWVKKDDTGNPVGLTLENKVPEGMPESSTDEIEQAWIDYFNDQKKAADDNTYTAVYPKPSDPPGAAWGEANKYGVPELTGTVDETHIAYNRAWAAYYKDNADAQRLEELSAEYENIDLGMGLQEDENGKLVNGTAFNRSLPGINMLGFGVDEDGDPVNLAMIMKRLGEIYSNCDPTTGAFSKNEEEAEKLKTEADRLLDKYQAATDRTNASYTDVETKAHYLQQNQARLKLQGDYLQEERENIENVDLADAITEFSWDYYCYSAALKVGTQLLSQSLIDYMS